MNIVIIEDEKPAAEKLVKALQEVTTTFNIKAVLSSIAQAAEWLNSNVQPDLIFMDIELTDGLSFKLFDRCNIACPVIFITAYDEYWQEAFEYNSIDYLLKPVKQEKLEATLKKYDKLKQYFAANFKQLQQYDQQPENKFRKRYLVKRGADLIAVKTEDIAYCYATHKLVCMVDKQHQKYILDKSLADIEKELEPSLFFRINRKYIANINAVKKIRLHGKGKLLIELLPPVEEEVIISNETVGAFKEWMGS